MFLDKREALGCQLKKSLCCSQDFKGDRFNTGHINLEDYLIIFIQKVKCKRAQEICPSARELKNLTNGLGPIALLHKSLDKGLNLIVMFSMSPARGRAKVSCKSGCDLCRSVSRSCTTRKAQAPWWKLESLHPQGEESMPEAKGYAPEPGSNTQDKTRTRASLEENSGYPQRQ